MLKLFSVFILTVISSLGFAKEEQKYDGVITWKIQPLSDREGEPVTGAMSRPRIYYYYNNEPVGLNNKGLNVIYNKLKILKKGNIAIYSRSLDGSGPTDDAILYANVWPKFNSLLRKKNISVTIIYKDDENDNTSVIPEDAGLPKKNPFPE